MMRVGSHWVMPRPVARLSVPPYFGLSAVGRGGAVVVWVAVVGEVAELGAAGVVVVAASGPQDARIRIPEMRRQKISQTTLFFISLPYSTLRAVPGRTTAR